MPVFVPVILVAGILATGWVIKETGDALENASELTKWTVIGGGLYVSYLALKSAGALK